MKYDVINPDIAILTFISKLKKYFYFYFTFINILVEA